jgi:hypothetical protein
MKIYLATWLTDRSLGNSLTKKKAPRRLLSYYFLLEQEISGELFNQYCIHGRCDPRKNKDK